MTTKSKSKKKAPEKINRPFYLEGDEVTEFEKIKTEYKFKTGNSVIVHAIMNHLRLAKENIELKKEMNELRNNLISASELIIESEQARKNLLILASKIQNN